MTQWIWLGIIFLGVTGLFSTFFLWMLERRERAADKARAERSSDALESDPDMFLENFAPALAQQLPLSESAAPQMGQELREAGYYSPRALTVYLAVRTLATLVPLFIAFGLATVVPATAIPRILFLGLLGALLGFSLPKLWVNARARRRKREIEKGLPVLVDLLSLAVSGGQSLLSAIDRAAREIRFSFPILADELDIIRQQARLNTLPHALEQWSDRVRIPEVQTLTTILTQADRLGIDINKGLLEFSSNMRSNLRQRADMQAGRTSFLMLFPTLFGLWIPAAVILIGPIVFEFRHRREAAGNIIKTNDTGKTLTTKDGFLTSKDE
jgi:tight adherence protein C